MNKKKNKKSKILIIILACAIIIPIAFIVFKKTNTYHVMQWNQAVKKITELNRIKSPSDSKRKEISSQWDDILDKLKKSNIVINKSFTEKYANSRNPVEILSDIYLLSGNDNPSIWVDDSWLSEYIPDVLTEFDRLNIELLSLHDYVSNNNGTYYLENPDASPLSLEKTSTTEAMVSIDENTGEAKYGKKENTREIEIYGDFAMEKYTEWSFDDGKLEWKAGTFMDEPGTGWNNKDIYTLWYKGRIIQKYRNSLEQFDTEMMKPINDQLYGIYCTTNRDGTKEWDIDTIKIDKTDISSMT